MIAIDLDSTIWTEDYPHFGVPYPNAIESVNELVGRGYEVIIWTSRGGDNLQACKAHLIHVLSLNPAIKFNEHSNYYTTKYPIQSPKIAASLYIDDKSLNAPDFSQNWHKILELFE